MSFDTFACGHDYGNSETCSVVLGRGSRAERCIPSVVSHGSWQQVLLAAAGAGKNVKEILAANHYVLSYDLHPSTELRRVEKYVGQKVFDDGAKPLETRGDSSRYWANRSSLELLMVASGSSIPDPEYGLHVVTGLPISIYQADPAHAELVREALCGTHAFCLNGTSRTMHVLSVKTIMEGAGALIAHGSSEEILQGVIDIGGRTTDLFVAKGQRPRAALCKGEGLGVAAAADRLNEQFRESYGYSLSLEARIELLRQHVKEETYRTVFDRKRIPIAHETLRRLIESALRDIGQAIATFVAAAWDEALMEIAQILIVGGGAHYFAQDIKSRLPHARAVARPEMANAAGYATLAEAIANRVQKQTLVPVSRSISHGTQF